VFLVIEPENAWNRKHDASDRGSKTGKSCTDNTQVASTSHLSFTYDFLVCLGRGGRGGSGPRGGGRGGNTNTPGGGSRKHVSEKPLPQHIDDMPKLKEEKNKVIFSMLIDGLMHTVSLLAHKPVLQHNRHIFRASGHCETVFY
jgi:hypothetical protein